jgi:CDP-glucose 4,6-dehydratase
MLKLVSSKARAQFGWALRWAFEDAVAYTIEWYRRYAEGDPMLAFTRQQIAAYRAATAHSARFQKNGKRVHA